MGVSVSDSASQIDLSARKWVRPCALGVCVSLLSFALAMGVAMWLYPGGNWLDRSAPGHRFFANFLCDLTQPVSLSGVENRLGSRCAQFGMLSFALALAGFFGLLPELFAPGGRAAPWVRALGGGAMLVFVAVPLTPSLTFGNWHERLALLAGTLGLAAALLAVHALWRAPRRARSLGVLGALAVAVGALDAALFVYHLGDAAPPLLVPAIQKVAAVLLCAWMLATAWLALAKARATRP